METFQLIFQGNALGSATFKGTLLGGRDNHEGI